jgi:hypothetical protein
VGIADSVPVRSFLSDASHYETVREMLMLDLDSRKIEFSTLVDSNLVILANANNERMGEEFDPSGVASKVMALNRRISVVTTMSRHNFLLEGAPRWL